MLMGPTRRRGGATVVEFAIIGSVTVLLMFGLIIGGLGIFRYQEMAWLARDAARYACVHGSGYQSDTGNASPTQNQIQSLMQAKAAGLKAASLTVQVQWIDMNTGTVTPWDSSSKAITTVAATGQNINAHVRVTVSYPWIPEALWKGPINLSSTSEIPMCN
jgi:Flp pilus assembly protein TadG